MTQTKTKWQIRAEQDEEYNELMWLRWYYSHIQMYINQLPFKYENYDTFQEWIMDYYEHPRWGSNFKLKVPKCYRKNAKIHATHGRGYDEITEDDK